MPDHASKERESRFGPARNDRAQQQPTAALDVARHSDARPGAAAQRQVQAMAAGSPQLKQGVACQAMADSYVERQPTVVQRRQNRTGLPDSLKAGIETLSGLSMDDVHVHYNSDKPTQLQAHAYAQGSDIYLAGGQEKHLAHEAWHVVQQKQGRVQPTRQLRGQVAINDESGLEMEADVMGARASVIHHRPDEPPPGLVLPGRTLVSTTIQGLFWEYVPSEAPIFHYGPVIEAIWAPKLDPDGKQELEEDGRGIWIRKTSAEYLTQLVEQDARLRGIVDGFQEAIAAVHIGEASREAVIESLQATHRIAGEYLNELKATLSKYAVVGMFGVAATVGVVAMAEHFLSLPDVPWGLKVAIDIAGVVYGAYVTVRWLQSSVIPKLASLIMAAMNTGVWGLALYAMFSEVLNNKAFESVHIGALPFAITLEILMRKLDQKIREKGERQPLLGPRTYGNADGGSLV